ncbi:S-adenosyl-L-methionine-dependent methyltransferases superfamily protein [Tripterygium wilfordii]|uniref:S-adenosyl-L-methionine-dependent methyltransferases superfamily protein n=1 Tax=Tripterygium wilfordii TaxID=458696 RepID=A0A7J7E011_TRIWF|nr:probable methyltransferase PMT26 [Tripterygium wilfordii]KAF5751784.1 S-adenosyl-L-methionine-dependent methyltransferases superfamily protein [Tripterygium wilfordii]
MALGKYSRIDNNRRSSSSYCSSVTIVVFVAFCLVGVWMMTSSSVVPGQNDVPAQENKNEVKEQVIDSMASNTLQTDTTESNTRQFEDNPGDLPEDATKGDSSENNNNSAPENQEEKSNEETNQEVQQTQDGKTDGGESKTQNGESEAAGTKSGDGESDSGGQGDSEDNSTEKKTDSDETEKKSDSNESNQESHDEGDKKSVSDNLDENEKKSDAENNETESEENSDKTKDEEKVDGQIQEKVDDTDKRESDNSSDEQKDGGKVSNQSSNEVFPSGAQSDLLNETTTQGGSWLTQAAESKNEKEAQQSSKQQSEYTWKLCNATAGPDFIPCLDNWQAIKSLRSTKHYEHRERRCPEELPTCLVPLPQGYKRSIEWPKSREKIWYYNVPHTKLAQVKGHQNWVKITGEYLTFPGGGTQFKHGALHYIDFINESVPDIAWGKRTRVILDVGCGVASFGGYLFDRDVLAMSFAPKDEHEAQVQFALERGIPAISAVMGTKRLPFPGRVFDIVHCARCRVPWHIEGGKLLLELNRVLRPGGFFVWSATPVYQKLAEDVEIWKAMSELTKAICWELISINKDTLNGVGVAIYRKPTSNDCYEKRQQQDPPICSESDDPNAAWNVPLQACMHKVPTDSLERGSQWPEQWPARSEKTPYWLLNTQTGVYGKPAPEDFTADYGHWKSVVSKSYLNGMGINWSLVRNVMDMRAVYGGFAAALRDLNVWVMNVISVDSPDTLPIIYERGLFGIYHDWCESFSTYPRTYDLLHADHLFSKIKKRCSISAVMAEADRILRPEGKLIVRDNVEIITELEKMARSMQWEVRMTYSKDKEGLLCVQKTTWRPKEVETLTYAIA